MLFPEEINELQFEVAFRGYNTREVDEFLSKLRSDLTEMVKEQESLRKKKAERAEKRKKRNTSADPRGTSSV